ncbi:MAG: hypothetical protein R3B99_14870 [Polyangiales bacterium]|nr:hypothetical protein [Myxococcales bacterium]
MRAELADDGILPGPAVVPRRLHLARWDQLRVIAAVDTVAIHLTGDHALYGFGLPLFLILAVALGVSKPSAPTTGRFVARRFERIVMPWVFWSAVLFGLRVLDAWRYDRPLLAWVEPEMLLYGPQIHLWFLPFVVIAGLLAHLAQRALAKHDAGLATPITSFALAAMLVAPASFGVRGWPFEQWLFSLPTIALGFGVGRCVALGDLRRARLATTAGFALFAALGLLVTWWRPEALPILVRYVGGLALLVGAMWLPNVVDRLTPHLVPLMLGVYVLHLEVHRNLTKPVMLDLGVYDERWLRVLVSFPLTMLVVYGLRQTPLRRFL